MRGLIFCFALCLLCMHGLCQERNYLKSDHWREKFGLTQIDRRQVSMSSMKTVGSKDDQFSGRWFYGQITGRDRTLFYRVSNADSVLSLIRGGPINVYILNPSSRDLSQSVLGGRTSGGLVRLVPKGEIN
ncbi:uncharacterized protein LOC143452237 [Clavelina lepadiformis]|uniref:uncharacterized protein LOC143452237 n=1 Tax=Clavelina lepadiformis TaxID=159417 RepID=UPI004042B3F1